MKYKHFVTIGHLDHGKSSLLGRLLWDMGRISEDTKTYLTQIGGAEGRQFAFVLDSKKEERGRGITIEVGHSKLLYGGHSFTFGDAPGHETFLDRAYRGIEESNGAILLVAVDEGLQDQARRHVTHALDIGIKDFVVCINKMDKAGYGQAAFEALREQVLPLFSRLPAPPPVIPTSALQGDNITTSSPNLAWFEGPSFLDCLLQAPAKENSIDELVEQSKDIIRQAMTHFKNPVMLWAGGKDSTTEIAIARELFNGKLPFPVMFIDTTYKFAETYDFLKKYAKEWELDYRVVKNQQALEQGITPWSVSHFQYCHELKTKPLQSAIREHGFDGVFTAIRWDEHGIRGKEQYFSVRTDPPHTRVHPMLHWSEKEIWDFIRSRGIPYNPLYDKEEHNGLVYRSIGCWPFTKPVPKDAPEERAGRELDKERLMEDLRSLGYM